MMRFAVVATLTFLLAACSADPIAERTDVHEKCRLDGKWLTADPFAAGNHAIVGDEAVFALLNDREGRHWVLDSATCALQEVELPPATASEQVYVSLTSLGDVRFYVMGRGGLPLRYILLDLATGKSTETTARPSRDGLPYNPRFSRDGRWAAWMAGEQTDRSTVQAGPTNTLDVAFEFEPAARFGRGAYAVVDVADGGGAILLGKDFGESFLLVDRSGTVVWEFTRDDDVFTTLDTVRFSPDGRVHLRWDAFRVVQWRIAGQLVRREIPSNSFIGSAAISSDWKWIAVSTNANTRGGSGIEAITVWSADGRVRFHKRLKPATRTPVVFLPGNLLAYVEVDENWHGVTRVLQLDDR